MCREFGNHADILVERDLINLIKKMKIMINNIYWVVTLWRMLHGTTRKNVKVQNHSFPVDLQPRDDTHSCRLVSISHCYQNLPLSLPDKKLTASSSVSPNDSSTFHNLALPPNPAPSKGPAFLSVASSSLKTLALLSLHFYLLWHYLHLPASESLLSCLNSFLSGHSFSMTFILPFLNLPCSLFKGAHFSLYSLPDDFIPLSMTAPNSNLHGQLRLCLDSSSIHPIA